MPVAHTTHTARADAYIQRNPEMMAAQGVRPKNRDARGLCHADGSLLYPWLSAIDYGVDPRPIRYFAFQTFSDAEAGTEKLLDIAQAGVHVATFNASTAKIHMTNGGRKELPAALISYPEHPWTADLLLSGDRQLTRRPLAHWAPEVEYSYNAEPKQEVYDDLIHQRATAWGQLHHLNADMTDLQAEMQENDAPGLEPQLNTLKATQHRLVTKLHGLNSRVEKWLAQQAAYEAWTEHMRDAVDLYGTDDERKRLEDDPNADVWETDRVAFDCKGSSDDIFDWDGITLPAKTPRVTAIEPSGTERGLQRALDEELARTPEQQNPYEITRIREQLAAAKQMRLEKFSDDGYSILPPAKHDSEAQKNYRVLLSGLHLLNHPQEPERCDSWHKFSRRYHTGAAFWMDTIIDELTKQPKLPPVAILRRDAQDQRIELPQQPEPAPIPEPTLQDLLADCVWWPHYGLVSQRHRTGLSWAIVDRKTREVVKRFSGQVEATKHLVKLERSAQM